MEEKEWAVTYKAVLGRRYASVPFFAPKPMCLRRVLDMLWDTFFVPKVRYLRSDLPFGAKNGAEVYVC